MSERKLTLIDIGPLLLSQYEECVEFKFFKEFKAYELRAEDIPHLFDIIDLLQIHEKDLVRHRQEIEIRILNYRINQLMPDSG